MIFEQDALEIQGDTWPTLSAEGLVLVLFKVQIVDKEQKRIGAPGLPNAKADTG